MIWLAQPESFHNAGGESFGTIPLLRLLPCPVLLTTSLEMGTEYVGLERDVPHAERSAEPVTGRPGVDDRR